MFELLFAWAIFTAVLGKSAEAVTHAWKGTAPPGHLRKMARIRAKEAAGLRQGQQPAGPARTWARTVWGDVWNEATERHAERWPTKAAKKREYARRRWAWWDGVEEESGRRWDERRARRSAGDPDEAEPAEEPATDSDKKTAKKDAEEAKDAEEPASTSLGLADLQRLSEANLAARQRRKRGAGSPSDTPDSTPKTPGQGTNGGVRGGRTPGQVPVSGADAMTTTEGSDGMAEVMNLSGATKFTRALNKSYNSSVQQLEEVMAWLHSQNIHSGNLHDRFQAILRTTADTAEMTEQALKTCEDQLKVRDAIEAAGGVALSKDALLKE